MRNATKRSIVSATKQALSAARVQRRSKYQIGRIAAREANKIAKRVTGSGALGNLAGSAISRVYDTVARHVTGSGDYQISKPSASKKKIPKPSATFASKGEEIRIRHREYVMDYFTTTGAFEAQTLAINPGLPESFPWLSNIAQQFTQYKMNGLVYELKSQAADRTDKTAQGYVCCAVAYNPSEDFPLTKVAVENSEWSQSGKPSEDLIQPVECHPRFSPTSWLYTRSDSPGATNYDLNFYDVGSLIIASGRCNEGDVLAGELWVTYDVTFSKPRQPVPMKTGVFQKWDGSTYSNTDIFNTMALASTSPDGITLEETGPTVVFAPNLIRFKKNTYVPGAVYVFTATWIGTTNASTPSWTVSVDNCSLALIFGPVENLQGFDLQTTSSTHLRGKWCVRMPQDNAHDAEVIFTVSSVPTNGQNCYMEMYQISGDCDRGEENNI